MQTGKGSRGQKVFLLVAMVIIFVMYVVWLNAVPDVRKDQAHDSFRYILLAQSLLAGEGYQTKHWPPGFPVLLTIPLSLFGLNWVWLKLTMVLMAMISGALAFLLYREFTSRITSLLLTLVLLSTPIFFDYSHRLMSEIPCVMFSLAALIALLRLRRDNLSARQCTVLTVALIAFGTATVLTRGNGLALIPALLGEIVLSQKLSGRQVRSACGVALLAVILIFSGWTLFQQRQTFINTPFNNIDNITYLENIQAKDDEKLWEKGRFTTEIERTGWRDVAARFYGTIAWSYLFRIPGTIFPGMETIARWKSPLRFVFILLLLLPMVIGTWILWRKAVGVCLYMLFSLAATLPLNNAWGAAPRMLIPGLPLLLLAGYLGLEYIFNMLPERLSVRRRHWSPAFVWMVIVLLINSGLTLAQARRQAHQPYATPAATAMAQFITHNLRPWSSADEPLIVRNEWMVQILAGISAMRVDRPDQLQAWLYRYKPDSVLLLLSETEAAQFLNSLPRSYESEELAREPSVVLTRLRKADVLQESSARVQ